MNEIHDINGLRLIVEKEEDCYQALEVVRQLWTEVPGKFKDYITQPKCNGYAFLTLKALLHSCQLYFSLLNTFVL